MIVIPLSEFGLMTVREVAAYHGATPKCVWRWVAEEKLPAVPAQRCLLIPRAACEKFVKPERGRPGGLARAAARARRKYARG